MAKLEHKLDMTYIIEAVEELKLVCKNSYCIPNHLKQRLEKMSSEKKMIKISKGLLLEPSEEFQCLLAELRVYVPHE